jgi:general nucleoside transport system permease protein
VNATRSARSSSRWQFKRQPDVPIWKGILMRVFAVVLALVLVGALLALGGMSPLALLSKALQTILGTRTGIQQTITLATPLVLTGLAVALGMRMRIWNIGAEGQLFMGALAATAVALHVSGPTPLMLLLMFLAGAAAGALWILVPALLKAYLNANEIITTLLLNFVAVLAVSYFAIGPWRDRAHSILSATPRLPYTLPTIGGQYLHIGFVVAILAAVLLALADQNTRWGYQMRLIGANRRAAEFAGMPVLRRIIMVMLLSGALAGVAGMIEVAGVAHRLSSTVSTGYGYQGIIVAALASASPLGVVPAGILLALLLNTGILLKTQGISVNTVLAINGVILIFAAIGEVAAQYHLVRSKPEEVEPAESAIESECADGSVERSPGDLAAESGEPGSLLPRREGQ